MSEIIITCFAVYFAIGLTGAILLSVQNYIGGLKSFILVVFLWPLALFLGEWK